MVVLGWIGAIIITLVMLAQAYLMVTDESRAERIRYALSFVLVAPANIYIWSTLV